MNLEPKLIHSRHHIDERGKITFFNDFDLKLVRRLYLIDHPNPAVVRAWQAHKLEQKWFYVIGGSFKVVIVQPDDWEHPSNDLKTHEYTLRSEESHVLHIPGGLANGFKALQPNSKMIVFSNFTVEESSNDNFRFNKEMWYDWNNEKD